MEPEKNIHEIFEEIAKENPPANKWKKERKGKGTYQTFGMVYGAAYGLIVGYVAGILLDKMSISIMAGIVIGCLVGRTIGYGFKKKMSAKQDKASLEKQKNPELPDEDNSEKKITM